MQLPPLPCYLVLPRSKYSPHHPTLKHPQPSFVTQCERPNSPPIQNNKIIVLYNFIITVYYYGLNELKIFPSRWKKLAPFTQIVFNGWWKMAVLFWFDLVGAFSQVNKRWQHCIPFLSVIPESSNGPIKRGLYKAQAGRWDSCCWLWRAVDGVL